jgi:hypothetical protein
MRKRLQNIIKEYPKIYIDEISFNDNTFEIEIDIWNEEYKERKDFVEDCEKVRYRLEEQGFCCAKDAEYSEYIYRLYIII